MQNILGDGTFGLSTKSRALIRLGGQCARCGINDLRVLSVHHKNGDGAAERKLLMKKYHWDRRQAQWDLVIEDTRFGWALSKYQALCHNCHDLVHNHGCRVSPLTQY